MTPKILFIEGIYPEFQRELYAARPELADQPHDVQLAALFDSGFGHADAYSHGFRRLGWDAADIVGDADRAQQRWAEEHGVTLPENIHDRRRAVVAAQIEHYRPDVLYVFEWSPLGDAFLAEMKSRVRLLIGQVASPLPAGRTYAAYDLMTSSFPPLVDHFRRRGIRAEHARLAFDPRVLQRIQPVPLRHDVTFVGGFAPSHRERIAWLERILRDVPVDVFGYGVETLPERSPIRAHHRGPVWGWSMYETLAASRVTLNLHAAIEAEGTLVGRAANNMRLYEATGVGTCLLTDRRPHLEELFEPQREVLTFEDAEECIARIREILADEPRRQAVAAAGQARTLREHTYPLRMLRLERIIRDLLGITKVERCDSASIPC